MKKDKEEKLYRCSECQKEVPTVYYRNGKWLCFECFKKAKGENDDNEDK